jgi:hypothetical protein
MKTINTIYDPKPIPLRNYDWEATRGDYDEYDPIGYGSTELEAITDLINQERTLADLE